MNLECAGKLLDLSVSAVMGILNVTPDSFSDGGKFINFESAINHARQMSAEGAVIIDVGGESTRPGAGPVSEQEELDRVIPVIEVMSKELDVIISVDTSKPAVMTEAVKAGAGFINDVNALRSPGALEAAVRANVPVCLMHMQGEPRTMQTQPHYINVIQEVKSFLIERLEVCREAGIANGKLVIDPGFGFGKTLEHNLLLFKHLNEVVNLNVPVMVGVSRKSMFGKLLGLPVDERANVSVAAAVICAWQGAKIIRTHDVRITVEALKVCHAIQSVN